MDPSTANSFRDASTFPYYYGYQITVGPNEKPHVREFGNVKPQAKELVEQSNISEPLVDSLVDEKTIHYSSRLKCPEYLRKTSE